MRFSIATVAAVAALGFAAPASQVQGQSDFVYQLQAQLSSSQNQGMQQQQLFTDGNNIYYGHQQNNVGTNGQPLVEINVFLDNNGNMEAQRDQNNRFVTVGDNGRMQLSDRRSGKWNYSSRNRNDDDVSLRFNDEQRFLACPVQQRGRDNDRGNWRQNNRDSSRSRNKRDEKESAAGRGNQNWGNQNNNGNYQDNGVYQVYVNNAPCSNPVELSLNGQKQGRRNDRQNWRSQRERNGRNKRQLDTRPETRPQMNNLVLQVSSPTTGMQFSSVFIQDGRMFVSELNGQQGQQGQQMQQTRPQQNQQMQQTRPQQNQQMQQTRPQQMQQEDQWTQHQQNQQMQETRPQQMQQMQQEGQWTQHQQNQQMQETRPQQNQQMQETRPQQNQQMQETRPQQNQQMQETRPQQNQQMQGQQAPALRLQLSVEGQLMDPQTKQTAQLGQNQQMSMASDNTKALVFVVNSQGNLEYNHGQFLACAAGNGLYEVRPTGAEGAAASCSEAHAIVIRVEQQQ